MRKILAPTLLLVALALPVTAQPLPGIELDPGPTFPAGGPVFDRFDPEFAVRDATDPIHTFRILGALEELDDRSTPPRETAHRPSAER